MSDLTLLKNELHQIAQRANREVRIFRSSPDLLSPGAVYAVENLDVIASELKQQIAVIAEHQAAAAHRDSSLLGGNYVE